MADTRVVKRRLNDSYRCGYCSQHFNRLEDPRTLPCLHVYCMSCLKTDIGYRKTHIKCAYCGKKFHDITDPTTLPVARFGDPIEYRSPPKPVPIPCDVCGDGTEAVVFCVESEKKLCEQHQQNHEEHMKVYMDTAHHFVPIHIYSTSPKRYTTAKCEHHEHHQLIEACSECHQRFCIRCDFKSGCAKVAGEKTHSHNIASLYDLSRELRDRLANQTKALSEKISVLNDLSKDAWRDFSELEGDAKKMLFKVDQIANAKIEEIKSYSQKLKEEIREYMRESGKIVDEYRIDLAWNKTLDKVTLLDSAQHMVDKFNDAEIVKTYKKTSEDVEAVSDISMIEKCLVPRKVLVPRTDEEDGLGLKLVQPPASLQFDGLSANGGCWTVSVTSAGHLMCRTADGVEVKNSDILYTIRTVRDTNSIVWGEVIQSENAMVGSCYNKREKVAKVFLLDSTSLQKTQTLYKHPVDKLTYCRIAQLNSAVYILNWREGQLVIRSLLNGNVKKLPIPGMETPGSLCVLPDATLLIGESTADGRVSRYKIENSTLTQLWNYPHIPRPTGISYDPISGLIHICTLKEPLFILSIDGELIQTIGRESLDMNDSVCDIAVYKDKVFLGCDNDGVRKYTMTY